jgi:hypothetical protein
MIDSVISGAERFVLQRRSKWDRSLVTATGCGHDGRGSIPRTGKMFPVTIPNGSGAPPVSYPSGTHPFFCAYPQI